MATIVLYAQMVARAEALSERDQERMATIKQQALHATNLIQRILDFSRRSVLERQPLDLIPFTKEHVKLLERTMPENIRVSLTYGPEACTVNADLTSIQQVMMNLALNARDAMPEGGDLRIELARIEVKPYAPSPLPEMQPGEWVKIVVSDTGTGIPPEAFAHIYEPFFTTKSPGQGSGLGLAQVHGIVAQHEGVIGVESYTEADCDHARGTTFTIYLPALPIDASEPGTLEVPSLIYGQGEMLLIVEDNAATRVALMDGLESLGYRVLTAENGKEALVVLERHEGEISLILSDVVMPEMGGIDLLQELQKMGQTIGVVLLTGHPLEAELKNLRTHHDVCGEGPGLALLVDWLLKPPSLEQLAEVIAWGIHAGEF